MSDLSLVPTEELQEELASRYEAFVMAGLEQQTPDAEYPGKNASVYFYRGGLVTAVGLARFLQRYLEGERSLIEDEEL